MNSSKTPCQIGMGAYIDSY